MRGEGGGGVVGGKEGWDKGEEGLTITGEGGLMSFLQCDYCNQGHPGKFFTN